MNKIKIPGLRTRTGYGIAGFILLLELAGAFIYMNATKEKLFSQNYQPYQVHTSRGSSERSAVKDAFQEKNMDSVISSFKASKTVEPEEYLLAGIAFLEKNQPVQAIETFKMLIQKNKDAKTDLFEEDAEYYLAMSYLSNSETDKAMPIFEKIQSEPEHPYNSNVSEWFLLNVKTLIAKK